MVSSPLLVGQPDRTFFSGANDDHLVIRGDAKSRTSSGKQSLASDKLPGSPTIPQVLLMGMKRSGKSSIAHVVYDKMAPHETLFLESNHGRISRDIDHAGLVSYQLVDFPGGPPIDVQDGTPLAESALFRSCFALIFVLDAQDDYVEALHQFMAIAKSAVSVKADIKFEVFIHKIDGLSEDTMAETQRDICQRANDQLFILDDHNCSSRVSEVEFHLTSIYDHSIFEAMSKVVQKAITVLPSIESLLNIFVQQTVVEKVFVFDLHCKLFLATDCSPLSTQSYEICHEIFDFVAEIASIYGHSQSVYDDIIDECLPANLDGVETVSSQESDVDGNQHFDSASLHLTNGIVLHLKQINKSLAIACLFKVSNFTRRGLIDRNFCLIKDSLCDVFAVQTRINSKAAVR